jgi:putative phosphoesterase
VRIALISDIHGNLPALEAVLGDLEQETIDQIVCLGDVATMGPFPVETLERVRDLECTVIKGNGDAAALNPTESSDENETVRRFAEMDRWSAEQLSAEHLAFIQTFQPTVRFELPGQQSLLCYHGSPHSYNDIISATTPDEEVEEMMGDEHATIMAGGHWHFPLLRRLKNTTLFNPGSVGLPYEFDAEGQVFIPPRAEYGIVSAESGNLRLEHRRVSYNSQTTVDAMHERDFPHADWWAKSWRQ